MYNFSVGVLLDSFRTDPVSALAKAKDVGASGIQVYATSGEMAPKTPGIPGQGQKPRFNYLGALRRPGTGLCQPGEKPRIDRAVQTDPGSGQGTGN